MDRFASKSRDLDQVVNLNLQISINLMVDISILHTPFFFKFTHHLIKSKKKKSTIKSVKFEAIKIKVRKTWNGCFLLHFNFWTPLMIMHLSEPHQLGHKWPNHCQFCGHPSIAGRLPSLFLCTGFGQYLDLSDGGCLQTLVQVFSQFRVGSLS